MQFDARIVGGESPVDNRWIFFALFAPSFGLLSHLLNGGHASIQTLSGKHVQSDLGDVEPTTSFGCEMNIDFVRDAFGLRRRKDFIQGGFFVRAQVVHDQGDGIGFGVVPIHQIFNQQSPISLGAALRNFDLAMAGKRFQHHE